jgi:hypothetical protein
MDRFLRVIFTLLFLLASVSNAIEYATPAHIVHLTGTKAQGRSSIFASTASRGVVDARMRRDQYSLLDQPVPADRKKFPCEFLSITTSGAVCDNHELEFPAISMKDVLEGDRYLPHNSITAFTSEKFVRSAVYRNITLVLRWEPATPEFLQIHLKEYLPYWENRIPYRLFWKADYEVCYDWCSPHTDTGEFLPEDIQDLAPSLAADVNFNGVPAAFWNENINP